MSYSLREALASFRRTPLLAILSVIAIGFSLFVVGLFGLTAYNIRRAIERVEDKVEVVGYLADDAEPGQVRAVRSALSLLPQVAEVRYVSKLEAMATARATMTEFRDALRDLEDNPLPASLEVSMRPGSRDPASVARVAAVLRKTRFVDDVRYGKDWLDQIFLIRKILGGVAGVIGGAFALVAAVVIATAIRITVFARREEIAIMRLVGATASFVRRPFLLEGVITGLLGGSLAVLLTYAAFRVLATTMMLQMKWVPDLWVFVVIAAGTVFGLLSSAAAVRRHLRVA